MTALSQYINSYFGVPLADIEKIIHFFQPTTLAKGGYFLKAGRICDKLSFHTSGLLRVYAEAGDKENTLHI